MHKFRNIFIRWFKKRSSNRIRFSEIKFVTSIADVPKKPGLTIYIVQKEKTNKWVVFKCPDDCGNRIEVNLMKSRIPFWNLVIKRKKITLSPSVVVESCHSHFWLVNNEVEWSA
jgi:hypothetical protein